MTVDYVTFSNLIVDDIVLPDGRTFMNTLGGAGMHALVGMRLWSDRLGYVATVGPNLDPAHRVALERFGVDLAGLATRPDYQTARAWQLFEPDERRIEIFRTDPREFERYRPTLDDVPDTYRQARGFHLQWGSLSDLEALIHALRHINPGVTLVWEATPSQLEESPSAFKKVLPHVNLISPDVAEAAQITGRQDLLDICKTLLKWGAPLVALRMGARGSLLCISGGERWWIPAVPTTIVDVTGAGNSYCGGFLTGLGDGLDPLEAALRGAVSASFALEQFGLPEWDTPPAEERQRRLDWARQHVKPYSHG